jgi:glycerol uptake facilitator-like aquaporin
MTVRAVCTEAIATAFLLIAVVGSGVMAERLSGGNMAMALLANALATGGALFALIVAFGPQSGAHMNPLVTIAAVIIGDFPARAIPFYIAAQVVGAVAGVWITHAMFAMPIIEMGSQARNGLGQWIAEAVATFGLLAVVAGSRAQSVPTIAATVAAYITGAYWFTASTAFANPAVTLARSLTDSFAGIRPTDVPGFIVAQGMGFILALIWIVSDRKRTVS